MNGSRSDRESREKDRDYKEYRDREFKDYKDYKEQKEYKEYSSRDHSSYPSYPGYTGQSAHVSQSNYPVQSAYPAQSNQAQSNYPNYPTLHQYTQIHTILLITAQFAPPQMLSQPSAPISAYRDEREKIRSTATGTLIRTSWSWTRKGASRGAEKSGKNWSEWTGLTKVKNDRIERVDRVVEQLPFPHDPVTLETQRSKRRSSRTLSSPQSP